MLVVIAVVVMVAAEIAALVEVAGAIGVAPAILALLVISASGPWLVRRAGFGVWRTTRARLAAGELPASQALDGVVLLAGGLLVCIPGFITDGIGLLLLVPPVRVLARNLVARRFGGHLVRVARTTWPPGSRGPVLDVDSHLSDEGPSQPLAPGDPSPDPLRGDQPENS